MSAIIAAVLLMAPTATPDTPSRCSPDPPQAVVQADAEAFIRKAEADWAASIARNEGAFLRRVTSNDFVAVYDGKVLTRAALIAEAEARREGEASNTLDEIRVHLSGSTAIAEGSEHWFDTKPARRTRIVWSDAWVHCGGQWRLTTSMSVSDPAQ